MRTGVKITLAVAGIGIVGMAIFGKTVFRSVRGRWDSSKKSAGLVEAKYHTVARGKLVISMIEEGRLKAVKNVVISSKLERQGKIAWVIAEGSQVKKGDKLIEFERKQIEDQIKQQEDSLAASEKERVIGEENQKIEESTGRSMVTNAETRLDEARKALDKYRDIEAPKQFKTLDTQIGKAKQTFEDATKKHRAACLKQRESMFADEAAKQSLTKEISAAAQELETAKDGVDAAILQQKMFKAYDYPDTLLARKRAVEQGQLDLEKARVDARSKLVQKETEILRNREQIRNLKQQLENLGKELENCAITAPIDGLVLYGDQGESRRRYRGSDNELKVGADVYPRNPIMTIPDLSSFDVDFFVYEERRGQVSLGASAIVTLDAVPGLRLEGKIKKIGSLAKPRVEWEEASPKVFDATLELSGGDSRMVSGMTARVEVVLATLDNVLSAPIEAIFNDGDGPFCLVRTPAGHEKRTVRTGYSNDDAAEITGGLREGEAVALFRPDDAGGGSRDSNPNRDETGAAAEKPAPGPVPGKPKGP
ncbi:MAG: efflux RND transporter periplasmic adaptor subunit [Planctomycetota bacterium]